MDIDKSALVWGTFIFSGPGIDEKRPLPILAIERVLQEGILQGGGGLLKKRGQLIEFLITVAGSTSNVHRFDYENALNVARWVISFQKSVRKSQTYAQTNNL